MTTTTYRSATDKQLYWIDRTLATKQIDADVATEIRRQLDAGLNTKQAGAWLDLLFAAPDKPVAGAVTEADAFALLTGGAGRQISLEPDDRLDVELLRRLVELDRAKHVVQIGQGHGRLAIAGRSGYGVIDADGAIDDREFGVEAEVDKHPGILSRGLCPGWLPAGNSVAAQGHCSWWSGRSWRASVQRNAAWQPWRRRKRAISRE